MPYAVCWKPGRIAPVIVMTSLSACAMGGSESGGPVCPPVMVYEQTVRDRAAAELEALPEGAALAMMMADYAVLRAQMRACRDQGTTTPALA